MQGAGKVKKSSVAAEAVPPTVSEVESHAILMDSSSRTDVLNRLKRAEGQLRGIQRMIEEGENCLKIGQQFSAVRKALDSTYMHMTVCYLTQELEARLNPDAAQRADLDEMMGNMETLLARMR